jgi:molecular chaperone GrpE
MDSFLVKHNVSSIDAIGEIFDPKLHEAISIIEDSTLDENTITKELRKGYISHNSVIRPTLVEISKKSKSESLGN